MSLIPVPPQQNVIERKLLSPEDSYWQATILQSAGKTVKLPYYITKKDGTKERTVVDCFVVSADHRTTEQAHWYLEANAVIAEPTNAGFTIRASTQSPSECQSLVATFLQLKNNQVDVEVKQLGGGYGGKTVRSPFHAVAAAAVARLHNRPAKLAIEREADSAITGRRHPYYIRVFLGIVTDSRPEFKEDRGTIAAFYMQAWADTGFYYDCLETVLNVAIEDSDGSYFAQLFRAEGQMLQTNKVANTAMRAFGHASIMAVENAIEAAGHCPGVFKDDGDGNSTSIRIRSMYKRDDTTPYGSHLSDCILPQIFYNMRDGEWYKRRIDDIRQFNKTQRWKKRGHCLQPAKYKMGFEFGTLEQGHAIVNVFKGDGSVLVMHDGVEIGQGLSTKVIQIAATVLRLPIHMIQIGTTGAKITPNPTSTGASSGSEIKGGATRKACEILKKRLEDWCLAFYKQNSELVQQGKQPFFSNWQQLAFWQYPDGWAHPTDDKGTLLWNAIVSMAYMRRIDLSAEGFYTNEYFKEDPSSNMPQVYGYVYACAYSEVEIDLLTGNTTIIETRLVVDAGKSMNPAVDIGQIEGAFIQGVGSVLSETVLFQPTGKNMGKMINDNTWSYKPPFSKDIPLKWWTNIFPSTKYHIPLNTHLLMSSKAMGEPPYVLSTSVYCAVKEAIFAARSMNGNTSWFLLPTPVTPQEVRIACEVKTEQFVLAVGRTATEMVPRATHRLLQAINEMAPAKQSPMSIAALACEDRNRSLKWSKANRAKPKSPRSPLPK